MASNPLERAPRPKNHQRQNKKGQSDRVGIALQFRQVVRKVPPRVGATNNRHNIYINAKTNFKAQLKRCEELLNSGIHEIYLHCLGYAITRGLNLALQLVNNSSGVLNYIINTSTVHLLDELHPLRDEDDISVRQRNNSALHIKIYHKNLVSTNITTEPEATTSANAERKEVHQQKKPQQQQQQQQQKKRYKKHQSSQNQQQRK